jgi:hypothetical protein
MLAGRGNVDKIQPMASIEEISLAERGRLAKLLDPRSAADATAAYYALNHPAERVNLLAYCATAGQPVGFIAVAQTGLDLFRRLLVPFVRSAEALDALLRAALLLQNPAILCLPQEQREWAKEVVQIDGEQLSELLRLDPRLFEPVINVLIEQSITPDGWPRFEIRRGRAGNVAVGVNWRGEYFAEIYTQVDPSPHASGFLRSVLAAMAESLLSDRHVALLRLDESQQNVRQEAIRLGFRPTGVRLLYADVHARRE